ncbi:MAG TPA: hypothetical protein VGE54_03990 [Brevundimonas sp.]
MSTIRPELPFAPQTQPAGPSAQARAAQAAFFKAALAGVEAAPRPQPQAATGGEPEQPRSPRPGSLLDIRV